MTQLILDTANKGTNPNPLMRLEGACILYDAKPPVLMKPINLDIMRARIGTESVCHKSDRGWYIGK